MKVYLDNAATTPMDPEVIDVVSESMRHDFANSGTVYKIGMNARVLVEQATQDIRENLNLPNHFRIIFTSGASEANNLFIKGLGFPAEKIAYLGLEHPSVMETLKSIQGHENQALCLLSSHIEGRLDIAAINLFKNSGIRLICLSHVNNEIGSVNDPGLISKTLTRISPRTRLFLDGAQAIGKMAVLSGFWDGVDGYSISGHKLNGPKGIGMLIYDSRLNLVPQIHGGNQQYGVRSGTLPVSLILGLARSVKLATKRQKNNQIHFKNLRRHLLDGLMGLAKNNDDLNIKINSSLTDDISIQSSAIVNFSFPPVEGEVLLHHLEKKNIYVGMGSACSAQSKEPSKILIGYGLSKEEARCSLRLSFGLNNTISEIDIFLREFGLAYDSLYPSFNQKAVRK